MQPHSLGEVSLGRSSRRWGGPSGCASRCHSIFKTIVRARYLELVGECVEGKVNGNSLLPSDFAQALVKCRLQPAEVVLVVVPLWGEYAEMNLIGTENFASSSEIWKSLSCE
jgi:hypothetical protein